MAKILFTKFYIFIKTLLFDFSKAERSEFISGFSTSNV